MIRTPPSVNWRDIAVKLVTGLKLLAAYSQHVEPLPGVMELAERVK